MLRHFSIQTAAIVATLAVVLSGGCSRRNQPERIILIVVDTLRADYLRSYGGHAWTPATQDLARSGQVYRSLFGSFHQTTMSMSAMFTGLTPSLETGDPQQPLLMTSRTYCGLARLHGAQLSDQCVPDEVTTLGEVMSRAGYETIGIVGNALLFKPFGLHQGFDEWVEVGDSRVPRDPRKRQQMFDLYRKRNGAAVNGAVRAALERRKSDRFFLYVHYMDAHDHSGGKGPYQVAVRNADTAVGDLMRILEEFGLKAGSTIVLTSDHGERLEEQHLVAGTAGHMGNPSFAEVLHVPLIISPPIKGEADRHLRTSDLFGLLARIAGETVRSNDDLLPNEMFLTESEWRTYQRGPWKSYLRRKDDRLFLVNLERDPHETRDLAEQHPRVARHHRDRIEALSDSLTSAQSGPASLNEADAERLRALGYVE